MGRGHRRRQPAGELTLELRDRVVLVTGASSGIGWVTAEAFARRGARVMVVARRVEKLERLAARCRELGARAEVLPGDLGEREFARRCIDETVARLGRIDVLVNNAAVSKHKQIYHLGAEEAERVMAVNFLSCVWTCLAAIPHMLRQGGGSIVNVSSFGGRVVPPREAIYGASKAAMSAFTEGLWNDLEGSGIHATLIVPGAIDTEIWEKLDEPAAFKGAKIPPEEVAEAILDAVVRRRYEVTVPRKLDLKLAAWLRFLLPSVLRMGMRRMDPVPPEVVERARERAAEQLRPRDSGE